MLANSKATGRADCPAGQKAAPRINYSGERPFVPLQYHLTPWQGCHTYRVENRVLKDFLQQEANVPLLVIETDYSQGDAEQIKTRVQAFWEMMD